MLIAHFLFALIFTLILIALFAAVFDNRGPWDSVAAFFIILLLATWAGGAWIYPFGPVLWGEVWLPFLAMAVIVALLLAAAVPPDRPRRRSPEPIESEREEAVERAVLGTLGLFFWILAVFLIIVIVAAYV